LKGRGIELHSSATTILCMDGFKRMCSVVPEFLEVGAATGVTQSFASASFWADVSNALAPVPEVDPA
jgi:hypothetical protein